MKVYSFYSLVWPLESKRTTLSKLHVPTIKTILNNAEIHINDDLEMINLKDPICDTR